MASFEEGKKAAAIKAVEEHVKSNDIVGIGSGSTIVYSVDKLAELVKSGCLTGIQCIPTSFQVPSYEGYWKSIGILINFTEKISFHVFIYIFRRGNLFLKII